MRLLLILLCVTLAQPTNLTASLLAAAGAGDAPALAALLPAPVDLAPALAAALAGWRASAGAWPPPAAQWAGTIAALLAAGAALPPAEATTAPFDALALHDAPALGALLASTPPAALAQCLAATRGAGGGTLLHHASRAPAPRASVGLFRLRREGGRAQALARRLGLAALPAWEAGAGGAAVLSAAALEEAVGAAELGPLGEALARVAQHGSSGAAARALTAADATGATPLDTACAEGRAKTAQWLLSRSAEYPAASPAASAAAAAARQRCVHGAAARGDAALLQALLAAPVNLTACFSAPDAAGRTPCDAAWGLGTLLGGQALRVLRSAGLCSAGAPAAAAAAALAPASDGESSAEDTARCPRGHASASARGPLDLPAAFSACRHTGAGWRLASSAMLQSLGLPGRLLSCTNSTQRQGGRQRRQRSLAGGAWCPIDVLQPAQLLPPARQALLDHYLRHGRPFVTAGAFEPGIGGGAALSRGALLAEAGGARVAFGAVPLEAAYSSSGRVQRVALGEFVAAHMGAPDARAPAAGPGANASRPMYVFDAQVLRGARGRGGALGEAAAALHAQLLGPAQPAAWQLAVGPPLSGAPPHLHRAAVNTLLAGLKLWAAWPPGAAFFVDGSSAGEWWAGHLQHGGKGSSSSGHFLFLQGPGEAVYLPPLWGHAVLNLADSVGAALE